jgi:hypothetical protein
VGCCSWKDGRELWRSRRRHEATEVEALDCTEVVEHLGSLFWRLCERDLWQEWAVFVLESLIVTSEPIVPRGRVVVLAKEALVLAVLVLLLLVLIVQRVDIRSVGRTLDRLAVAPRHVEDWVVVHCECGCSRDVKRRSLILWRKLSVLKLLIGDEFRCSSVGVLVLCRDFVVWMRSLLA